MHEFAVTEQIVEIALGEARGRRITAITLVLGELCGIVDESVRFCFDVIAAGTPAEGAALVFEKVRAQLRCRACGGEFGIADTEALCPRCGAIGAEVVRGREFYMESIEVEEGVAHDEDQGGKESSRRE